MIGVGKMGGNMTRRLLEEGHRVTVADRHPEKRTPLVEAGASEAVSVEALITALAAPRVVWSMVAAGEATERVVGLATDLLSPGDVLIDGGNSHYTDTLRHAAALGTRGIRFLDAGTSGGVWGLKEGYCFMVGGDREAFDRVQPILRSLSHPNGGYAYLGTAGAGHFAKMVHNGVEYGLMQAYGEGFELLRSSAYGYDLGEIATLWQRGSVVRSWLLELLDRALAADPDLSAIRGVVADSGEGRWTVLAAVEAGVPVPAMSSALFARYASRQDDSFSAKVAAALRNQFGGHAVQKSGDRETGEEVTR